MSSFPTNGASRITSPENNVQSPNYHLQLEQDFGTVPRELIQALKYLRNLLKIMFSTLLQLLSLLAENMSSVGI